MTLLPQGSFGYANWLKFIEQIPNKGTCEYPIYADAVPPVLDGGPWELGPYTLFATHVHESLRFERPSFVLRISIHLNQDDFVLPTSSSNTDSSNTDRYTGGLIHTEIASLLSLLWGTRLKIGEYNRYFDQSHPPGSPWDDSQEYSIVVPRINRLRPLLPHLSEKKITVDQIRKLVEFVSISPDSSLALVKSAKLYQEAIWIAEIDPSQAWILLVSAIETAADYWSKANNLNTDDWEVIGNWNATLKNCLERSNLTETELKEISDKIKELTGATRKFVNFIIQFFPNEPPNRPILSQQHDWCHSKIKKSISLIYSYRSKALHSGNPFPKPMCEGSHFWNGDKSLYPEIPVEIAQSGGGGSWLAKDTPMTLYLFEYIVRESLIRWWASCSTTTRLS